MKNLRKYSLVFALTLTTFLSNANAKEAEIDAALKSAAKQLNTTMPKMVDSDTRVDNVVVANRTFRYNYTLVNYLAVEMDATVIKNGLQEQLFNSVCNTKKMKFFVKNNIPVLYAYYGKDNKLITVITINPSQC